MPAKWHHLKAQVELDEHAALRCTASQTKIQHETQIKQTKNIKHKNEIHRRKTYTQMPQSEMKVMRKLRRRMAKV